MIESRAWIPRLDTYATAASLDNEEGGNENERAS